MIITTSITRKSFNLEYSRSEIFWIYTQQSHSPGQPIHLACLFPSYLVFFRRWGIYYWETYLARTPNFNQILLCFSTFSFFSLLSLNLSLKHQKWTTWEKTTWKRSVFLTTWLPDSWNQTRSKNTLSLTLTSLSFWLMKASSASCALTIEQSIIKK